MFEKHHFFKWELRSVVTLRYSLSFEASRTWADDVLSASAINSIKPLIDALVNANCNFIPVWGNNWSLLLRSFEGNPKTWKHAVKEWKSPCEWIHLQSLDRFMKEMENQAVVSPKHHLSFLPSLFKWQWKSVVFFRHTTNKFSPNSSLMSGRMYCVFLPSRE